MVQVDRQVESRKGSAKEFLRRLNRVNAKVISEYYEWVFDLRYNDWLNTDNELTLSGYTPDAELMNTLENKIDIELE